MTYISLLTLTWFLRDFRIFIRVVNEEIHILVLCFERFALTFELSESQIQIVTARK